MDWMQFVAAIVGSLAWPGAAVILAVMLRKPLAKLLPQIKSLRYKDLHVDLSQQLEEVKVAVEGAVDQDGAQPQALPEPDASQSVLSLARLDARAAILTSWVDVERALRDLANRVGVKFDRTPMSVIGELHALDAIDELLFNSLRDLRRVRNEAAHFIDRNISYEDAFKMETLCRWVVQRLRRNKDSWPSE